RLPLPYFAALAEGLSAGEKTFEGFSPTQKRMKGFTFAQSLQKAKSSFLPASYYYKIKSIEDAVTKLSHDIRVFITEYNKFKYLFLWCGFAAKAFLVIFDPSCGSLVAMDSHSHGDEGAMIVASRREYLSEFWEVIINEFVPELQNGSQEKVN
uniref:SMI1/KNR4 family protein n=1 Tax=Panagrolaimus sp. ES5 TaxID=591445 RepID=A0AC34GE57_9BILA